MGRRTVLRSAGGLAGAAVTLPLALSTLATLAGCDKFKPGGAPKTSAKFNAVDITGADYARRFQLKDFDGKPRALSDFKGKVVFVFFGFTQCPDVCPTTMTELAEVRRRYAMVKGQFTNSNYAVGFAKRVQLKIRFSRKNQG